eukprot:CAMPEP_0171521964 /NCGR_PEP_ID=MMETSP0959-20130129/7459_1 /TAXON_ID=87120 /ORGANISM="Aurantiochytrium limacinum, Strain ATCCMYA-1381" /LENGTH=123 /DNA_ID=CAMNT_0012061993 /DNA_START=473 /DNA_END=844 /DNA_ORIENTATION=+
MASRREGLSSQRSEIDRRRSFFLYNSERNLNSRSPAFEIVGLRDRQPSNQPSTSNQPPTSNQPSTKSSRGRQSSRSAACLENGSGMAMAMAVKMAMAAASCPAFTAVGLDRESGLNRAKASRS